MDNFIFCFRYFFRRNSKEAKALKRVIDVFASHWNRKWYIRNYYDPIYVVFLRRQSLGILALLLMSASCFRFFHEITSEIFSTECRTSKGIKSPLFFNVSRTLSWTRLWGRAHTDAEISAVPRRDLPHNDAQSPSSMNAPIFPFNKLMPQCHSIFRLLVRHEEIGRTRANRRLNVMRHFSFLFLLSYDAFDTSSTYYNFLLLCTLKY